MPLGFCIKSDNGKLISAYSLYTISNIEVQTFSKQACLKTSGYVPLIVMGLVEKKEGFKNQTMSDHTETCMYPGLVQDLLAPKVTCQMLPSLSGDLPSSSTFILILEMKDQGSLFFSVGSPFQQCKQASKRDGLKKSLT